MKIDRSLTGAKSRSALFLLFLLPGLPKDFLCYAAGLSSMSLFEFVLLSGLARSPALLASVLIGTGVSRGDYRAVIAIALLALLAIGGYYWYHRRLNVSGRTPPRSPEQGRAARPTDS